jgi:hypothetical protein
MAGITELCEWLHVSETYLTPGSTAVAYYGSGEILAAVKDNRSVVTLNIFVGSWRTNTGQVAELYHNAVMWLADEDLPWLTESPITGTLPAETGLQDVAVSFDAGVPEINQPGEYSGWLKVKSDTPYTPVYLPVNMTVTPPNTYGKLEGIVQSLGQCDAAPAPLENASLEMISGSGMVWTVETDATGYYQVWGNATSGPLTVIVSAQDHLQGVFTDVILTASQTVTQDFSLRALLPCVSVADDSLDVNVPLGLAKTVDLAVLNSGAGSSPLVIKAVAGTGFTGNPDTPEFGMVGVFQDAYPFGGTIVTETLAANGIPYVVHTSSEFATLDFSHFKMILIPSDQPQGLIDAYAANAAKFESFVNAGGFLALFTPVSMNNGGLWNVPLPGGMIYYVNAENYNVINDPTHPVLAGVPDPFGVDWDWASLGYFSNLPTGANVIASDQNQGGPTLVEYPIGEGLVLALTQWVEYPSGPTDVLHIIMDNTYRWGANYVPAPHAAWLEEDILTGTLEADSSLSIELTFTTLPTMTVGEVYTATLWIMSKDPSQPRIAVTVRLHVVTPTIYMPVIWKSNP